MLLEGFEYSVQVTKHLSYDQKNAILGLWNNEYPQKLVLKTIVDLEGYFAALDDLTHHLIYNQDNIVGWYFNFYREDLKWFAIILDSASHGKGIGTMMLDLVRENETELNGWVIDHNNDIKVNGMLYKSPLDFYVKNGFKILPDKRLETEMISAVQIRWKKD